MNGKFPCGQKFRIVLQAGYGVGYGGLKVIILIKCGRYSAHFLYAYLSNIYSTQNDCGTNIHQTFILLLRANTRHRKELFMQETHKASAAYPLLKTIHQMSQVSGLGEEKLRRMIRDGEIDYVCNGNRYLLAEKAIWAWYERNKVVARGHGRR